MPSTCGFFVTVILFVPIAFYGITQLVTLSVYGNTTVMNNLIDSHYDESYIFDLDKKDNGFQIAFGITAYDDNQEMIDDPDYVTIHARLKEWGNDGMGTTFTELPIRPCTRDDLGLDVENKSTKFYPAHKNSEVFMNYYWQKFYCVDSDVFIRGNY